MSTRKSHQIPDGAYALLASLLWSSAFVAIKTGYASGIGPFLFAGIRFSLSGLVLMLLLRFREGPGSFRAAVHSNPGLVFLVGLLQTGIMYAAFYSGVSRVPASVAAIVIGAQPLLTSVFSSLVPPVERIRVPQWFFLVSALAGLVILSLGRNPGSVRQGFSGESAGLILLFIAMLSSAGANIVVSRSRGGMSSLALSSGQFISGGTLLLLAALFFEDNSGMILDYKFVLSLIWLIIVSSTGISLWFWLLQDRKSAPGALSTWKFAVPVFGAILGWALVPGDRPDVRTVTGMLLIGLSVLGFFRVSRALGPRK